MKLPSNITKAPLQERIIWLVLLLKELRVYTAGCIACTVPIRSKATEDESRELHYSQEFRRELAEVFMRHGLELDENHRNHLGLSEGDNLFGACYQPWQYVCPLFTEIFGELPDKAEGWNGWQVLPSQDGGVDGVIVNDVTVSQLKLLALFGNVCAMEKVAFRILVDARCLVNH